MRRLLAIVAVLILLPGSCLAVEPDEILDNPVLEQRARDISHGLRCLVCQNQSIDDSNAPLAKDLRVLVRDRLKAGDTNDEVIDYVVARYGEFVLLQPRFAWHTLVLWIGPFLLLILGAFTIYRAQRRYRTESGPAASPGLSGAEKRRLAKLLKKP